MNRPLKKNEKIQIGLLALSCVIIVLGILFLVNAMQEDPSNGFFPAFCEMDNILAKYIIVILTMACGIMLFSNVGITVEDKNPIPFEAMTNPVDALMRTDRIYEGFVMWFGDGGLLWAALVIMLLLSLVFITFPLLTGILAVKNGQTLGIKKKGNRISFGVITLPVLEKQRAEAEGTITDEEAAECAEEPGLPQAAAALEEEAAE